MSPPTVLPALGWLVRMARELLVPVAILFAALALVALLFWADEVSASARPVLDELGVLDRLSEAWPDIIDAAAETRTDPLVLAAMAIHESRMLAIIGGRGGEMYGPLQVRW